MSGSEMEVFVMRGISGFLVLVSLGLTMPVEAQSSRDTPCVVSPGYCECVSYLAGRPDAEPVCVRSRLVAHPTEAPAWAFSTPLRIRPWRHHTPEMWASGLVLWSIGYAMSYVSYSTGLVDGVLSLSPIPFAGGFLAMDYYGNRIESMTRGYSDRPSPLYTVWGMEIASSIAQIAGFLCIVIGLANPSGDRSTRGISFDGTNLTITF